MAVKKTQMYRKNLDTSETNLYPLTEAQYVSMENGQTVQEILSDRDSDKYTPVITNSSSTFKVGQGDNVDLSSSMKEGAYDSCVLKGKTMVNCIQEPSSKDVVLPYEFADGRYVTINDTKESGALGVELKGQTLVNLLNFNKIIANATTHSKDGGKITVSSISERAWASLDIFIEPLKPNTDYILMIDNVSFTHSDNFISTVSVYCRDGNVKLGQLPSQSSNFFKFNTADKDLSLITLRIHATLGSANSATTVVNGLRVLEYQQGMENWDIPYFEGMTSCKMPILKTTGKNLFDKNNYIEISGSRFYSNTVGEENVATEIGDLNHKWVMLKLPIGKTYSVELDKRNTHPSGWTNTVVESDVNTILKGATYRTLAYALNDTTNVTRHTFTTTKPYVFIHVGYSSGYVQNKQELLDSIILNVGSSVPAYEPYKSSILSLPEEVVLRSLPNGVCDTFNTRTGVYTQRIEEVVLNGSENWAMYALDENFPDVAGFYHTHRGGKTASGVVNQNYIGSLPVFAQEKFPGKLTVNEEGVGLSDSRYVKISILKSKLSSIDSNGLKQWLQSNPMTIQYELADPVVTKINLSSTLKSWNTTTHIYSEIPENTLYPILSHSNPTYPVILKPNTKYSIVANSYSNNHTNSAINFNLGGATASTTVGNRVTTITTPSTLSNELLTMSGRGNKLNNVMVIEGDVVGDESYFEGMCDSKSPILLNCGKNLFNVNDLIKKHNNPSSIEMTKTNTGFNMKSKHTGAWHATNYSMQLKPNTQYIFNCVANTKSNTGSIKLWNDCESYHVYRDVFLQNTANLEINITFTTKKDGILKFQLNTTRDISALGDVEVSNVSLYELTNQTTYEPYKSNTTTFNQKDDKTIVLRSLPSGVCDTLNVETGEYVQNVVDVVLDGTENWTLNNWGTNDDFCSFEISSLNNAKIQNVYKQNSYINFYCDTFRVLTKCEWNYMGEKHIRQWSDGNRTTISVIIPKSELKTYDVTGFIEYLTKNNIRINIRANNPIVSTVDIQGFPYAYANGHVQLSSGSIEQSLTPKVEYSLSANKTGQIDSNTRQVVRQQKQLDDFEAMMLTSLVQSAYDKAILQFDYEMQMMSLGGE